MENASVLVKSAKTSGRKLLSLLETVEVHFAQFDIKAACRRDISFIKSIETGLEGLVEENFKEEIEILWMKVNGWSRDAGGYINDHDKRRFEKLSNKFWKDMLNLYKFIHSS